MCVKEKEYVFFKLEMLDSIGILSLTAAVLKLGRCNILAREVLLPSTLPTP